MRDYPIPDARAATTLGKALRDVGYTEPAVEDLLGDDAYSLGREDAPVGERRLPQTKLATVIRALFLQQPVAKQDAVAAIGRGAVAALEATGLAELGDELVPRVRIIPARGLLVASDDFPESEDDAEYVAAYTPTSQLCDYLTPRRRVARALDVGTGSGVLALLAAKHARQVVATDVNPRALAYGELNAALNGITNVDFRRGSLFEPVANECFDLITSNAPYVVSPENRLTYRDAGEEGDGLSERIVRSAAEHLDEDGFATLIVSWIAADENAPDERVLDWTDELDCDDWILPVWGSDPLDHAKTWNEHLADDGKKFSGVLDTWTAYFERLGVRWVTEGAVLLHRRAGGHYSARVDEVDEELLEPAGDQVLRAFASRARLAELRRAADLFDARLSVAAPLRLEHDLRPRRGRTTIVESRVEIDEGTQSLVEGSPRALEIVTALDGSAPLGELVREEDARLRREVLELSQDLLELGALRFR